MLRRALSRALLRAIGAAALACGLAAGAQAASLRHCDAPAPASAAQHDRLLRVSGWLQEQLAASGAEAALVARSGLNLRWFGQRYSHAGLALAAHPEVPWAVRQLYFACDEQRSRLFDQGLPAFLLGTEDPDLGFLSVLLLPPEATGALAPLALDNRRALALLGARYSANAYPFDTRYQNCNQWLAELLAVAWGGLAEAPAPREAAQRWLRDAGYQGAVFQLPWRPMLWLTAFSPWLHTDDHPEAELAEARFVVSMPESIEAWVRQRVPQARRLELCHTATHAVLRRDGPPLPADCQPADGDAVLALAD